MIRVVETRSILEVGHARTHRNVERGEPRVRNFPTLKPATSRLPNTRGEAPERRRESGLVKCKWNRGRFRFTRPERRAWSWTAPFGHGAGRFPSRERNGAEAGGLRPTLDDSAGGGGAWPEPLAVGKKLGRIRSRGHALTKPGGFSSPLENGAEPISQSRPDKPEDFVM